MALQLELLDLPAAAPIPTARPDLEFQELYQAALPQIDRSAPAAEISRVIIRAVFDAISAMSVPSGIQINSSCGKDSTLMTSLVVTEMLKANMEGRFVPRVLVGISDTKSEFPEMAARMREEAEAINDFGQRNGVPIEVHIVGPDDSHTLLGELIGNGLALPPHANSKGKMAGASWCMDRVKRTPLEAVVQLGLEEFEFMVQMIGTRTAESARRMRTTTEYAEGLPVGLTLLKGGASPHRRQGCTPIVHFTDHELKEWMTTDLVPWNFVSLDNLRQIYRKGSSGDDLLSECGIVVTQEGSVTNVCSDLGGARLGCWMCLLSKNKSLINTASHDVRYKWLAKFHRYIYLHHKRGEKQRKLKTEHGFTQLNCFPKGFTSRERAFMMALLFRAEMESGFPLISEGEVAAIDRSWARQGFFGFNTASVRRSVIEWRRSGKLRFEWETDAKDAWNDEFLTQIATGLLGSGSRDPRRFDLAHLVAASGGAQALAPVVRAWVFVDRADNNRQVVVVSDSILSIGSRAQGLIFGNWDLLGSRLLLPWEAEFSQGRVFIYVLEPEAKPTPARIESRRFNEELIERHNSCEMDYYLFDHIIQGNLIHESRGTITPPDFETLVAAVGELTVLSENIEDLEERARRTFNETREALGIEDIGLFETRGEKLGPDILLKLRSVRTAMRPYADASASFGMKARGPLSVVAEMIRDGRTNSAVVARLVYMIRTSFYDETYAAQLEAEIRSALGLEDSSTTYALAA